MLSLLCAMSLFATQAPEKQAAPKTPPPSLETEVRQALRRSALDGFVGTVSFRKEMWYPHTPGDAKGHSLQEWRITTDGNGQIRVRLHWPNAEPEPLTQTVVESHLRMWSPSNNELMVWDKENPPLDEGGRIADHRAETTHWLMRQTVDSARAMLRWLLGARAERSSIQILVLNRDPADPSAVVKVGDQTLLVRFTRLDGTLLVHSTLRSNANTTYAANTSYAWTFSDYELENGRWIARDVFFEQHSKFGGPLQSHYSLVNLAPAEDTAAFQKTFWVPQPGEPEFDGIIVVTTFSKSFVEKSVVTKTNTDGFPRLKVLNNRERGAP